jgi:hypothetical protein
MVMGIARAGVVSAMITLGACSSGGGDGTTDPEPNWEQISGETWTGCNTTCDWTAVGNRIINDFAFDGDDVLVSMREGGGFRLSLATGMGTRVDAFTRGMNSQLEVLSAGVFVKGNAFNIVQLNDRTGNNIGGWMGITVNTAFDVSLRVSPEGHVLSVGPLAADDTQRGLVDIDPSVPSTVTETPLPAYWIGVLNSFAADDQGRVYYQTLPEMGAATLNILDRATGIVTKVVYPDPPPDADGSQFRAFTSEGPLWGPAPGGGIFAYRQAHTGADVVRVTADGQVIFVVHAELAASGVLRLRERDGYLYAGGFGIWRTKQRVF